MSYPTAGVNGAVKIGGVTVANLSKWTISGKGVVAKTTSFGASGAWEATTPLLKSWTATLNGYTDPSDTNGQATLLNGLLTSFALELDVDGTHHWSGNAWLTQLDPDADAEKLNAIKLQFTGNGACTFA